MWQLCPHLFIHHSSNSTFCLCEFDFDHLQKVNSAVFYTLGHCLISLSIMSSRFIHVEACVRISFPFSVQRYLFQCISLPSSVDPLHSSTHGHLLIQPICLSIHLPWSFWYLSLLAMNMWYPAIVVTDSSIINDLFSLCYQNHHYSLVFQKGLRTSTFHSNLLQSWAGLQILPINNHCISIPLYKYRRPHRPSIRSFHWNTKGSGVFICLYCQEEPTSWDLNWLMVTNGVTIILALKYCHKDVQGTRVNKALQPWNHFSYFGKFCDLEWDGKENHKSQCWGPPRFLVCAVTFLQLGTKYSYTHRRWLWDRVGRKSGRAVK